MNCELPEGEDGFLATAFETEVKLLSKEQKETDASALLALKIESLKW